MSDPLRLFDVTCRSRSFFTFTEQPPGRAPPQLVVGSHSAFLSIPPSTRDSSPRLIPPSGTVRRKIHTPHRGGKLVKAHLTAFGVGGAKP